MALAEAETFDNRMAAEIARGYLASAGIEAVLFDDALSSLGMGGMTPVRLMVEEDEVEEARALLADVGDAA